MEPNAETPWYFAYAAIPLVFAKYPEAEGLLWSNDDVVINYWNYMAADKVSSLRFAKRNEARQVCSLSHIVTCVARELCTFI